LCQLLDLFRAFRNLPLLREFIPQLNYRSTCLERGTGHTDHIAPIRVLGVNYQVNTCHSRNCLVARRSW
jgi:hypothetical protein